MSIRRTRKEKKGKKRRRTKYQKEEEVAFFPLSFSRVRRRRVVGRPASKPPSVSHQHRSLSGVLCALVSGADFFLPIPFALKRRDFANHIDLSVKLLAIFFLFNSDDPSYKFLLNSVL